MPVLEYEVGLVFYMTVLVYDRCCSLMAVIVYDFDLFLRRRSCFSQSGNRKRGTAQPVLRKRRTHFPLPSS